MGRSHVPGLVRSGTVEVVSALPVPRTLLFVVNSPSFFLSHRLPIAHAARAAGYGVQVATMDGDGVERIISHGFVHHKLPMTRSGINPVAELRTVLSIWALFRRLRPDIVHLVTIKPVIYGGLVARAARVPAVVAAVSGLGFVFVARGVRARFVRWAAVKSYRAALNLSKLRVVFQNASDRDAFVDLGIVRSDQVVMVRGSGVDLTEFTPLAEPTAALVVVMAARLLVDKGVREFVAAARLLRTRGVAARFQLVGDVDLGNPSTIDDVEVAEWRKQGVVEVLGDRRDVARIFAAANVVVLPSYYGEGLPKVLIEAAACGRAVITTDMPGCRDAVEPGRTGLIVPPRDVVALADAIEHLAMDRERCSKMGRMGRALAEREFDVRSVVAAHLAMYAEISAAGCDLYGRGAANASS